LLERFTVGKSRSFSRRGIRRRRSSSLVFIRSSLADEEPLERMPRFEVLGIGVSEGLFGPLVANFDSSFWSTATWDWKLGFRTEEWF